MPTTKNVALPARNQRQNGWRGPTTRLATTAEAMIVGTVNKPLVSGMIMRNVSGVVICVAASAASTSATPTQTTPRWRARAEKMCTFAGGRAEGTGADPVTGSGAASNHDPDES